MSSPPSLPSNLTTVILAGGAGRRMGGVDKGLVLFEGRPLIEHVIARVLPQSGRLLISANRSEQHYSQYGYPVISDTLPDFPGPLAGILAALEATNSELLLAVPCDTPRLPVDLVQRLTRALDDSEAEIATPFDGERTHAAIMLMHRTVTDDLRSYLLSGERKVQAWLKRHHTVQVDFSDQPGAFANLNTLDELTHLEQQGDH